MFADFTCMFDYATRSSNVRWARVIPAMSMAATVLATVNGPASRLVKQRIISVTGKLGGGRVGDWVAGWLNS